MVVVYGTVAGGHENTSPENKLAEQGTKEKVNDVSGGWVVTERDVVVISVTVVRTFVLVATGLVAHETDMNAHTKTDKR